MIGVGEHGTSVNLKGMLAQGDVRVVAVCDVDRARAEAARRLTDQHYGDGGCGCCQDFREILARPDIDAVAISTPDHWHVPISVMAMRAGMDVFCEKPTLTIAQGRALVDVVRRTGRVFQTATEDRSVGVYHRMAELVRNGRIGKLQTIRVSLPGVPPDRRGNPGPMPVPPELDYDLWLGPAPWAPYAKDRVHHNFRWIRDYSGGILADWGMHMFDTAQWANDTDRGGPIRVDASGKFYDDPLYDTLCEFRIEYSYANGVTLIAESGGTGLRFEGTEGWVGNAGWRKPLEASSGEILRSVIGPGETHLFTCPAGEHRNFIDCVKSRREPYFPAEIGHRVATVCHIGNIAALLGRPLKWDPVAECFPDDPEANRHIGRAMRAPWRI
ncbi:MAG: Gfo/Idh/MocA family oxidoreductase, partial [Verrucomicrobiae bacterium]|nr:Gfo/Idh/MocA family oxidoreductase [Verrucomicrobiae bacterium]